MNIKEIVKKHRLASIVVASICIGGGVWVYHASTNTTASPRFVLAHVTKGTLITSVSGGGQINASNQVDIKPKLSGELLSVNVKSGDHVRAGQLIAYINAEDAAKAVRDAQTSLETAQLSFQKLQQPPTDYELMQAKNALTSAKNALTKLTLSQETQVIETQQAKQKAEDNLSKAYEDAFNTVANTFLNLPTTMTKLNDILSSNEINTNELKSSNTQANGPLLVNAVHVDDQPVVQQFLTRAQDDYQAARTVYDINFGQYKNTTRYADRSVIEALLDQTLETTKAAAQAAKSESNLLDAWVDARSRRGWIVYNQVKTYQSNLTGYISQTNASLSSLLTVQRALQDNRESLASAERDLVQIQKNNPLDLASAKATVSEREASLVNVEAGPDPLDIRSQELSVKQRENALIDARKTLADASIRAPFDGVIAKVAVKKGDTVSSGTSVATIVTTQQMAEISLNEVDAAKVQVGQKATITFDALPDLSLTGLVADVDTIGTVTQGVVTYNVTITFDTQDSRVKPGMSISVAIITSAEQDVLLVPSAAVKNTGGVSIVEVPDEIVGNDATSVGGVELSKPPLTKTIGIGASNDTSTVVTSGLAEGDWIIVRTITAATTPTQQQGQSIFSIPRGGAATGGTRAFGGTGR